MTERATSSFDVTAWNQTPYGESDDGPALSRATVRKRFEGDLTGESTAELLMCQADPDDLSAGAGYVASELVTGRLAGREGTFVLQHWGLSEGGSERTGGRVVPGSGTGDLEGLRGEVEIEVDAEGGHTLTLEYEL
ncbi:MAG: DUF3224 domain-containing protein [Gemmatimonadota bacterium]|nr:DUF3224 domain-containing protein [Gemmatimonadota bacterium]